MQFINTRPHSRARALTDFLQAHHIEVIELPLLELVEKPLDAAGLSVLQAIYHYRVVILVSEAAVKYGLANLAKFVNVAHLSQSITWLAVGEKTATCFVQTWRQRTDYPPPTISFPKEKHQQNNEGLLNLPLVQALGKGDKVQIWRGIDGRELLADTLKSQGLQVDLLNFYQRVLPIATEQKFAAWQRKGQHSQPSAVLMSSLSAWQHWQQLTAATDLLTTCHYVVLQPRIAAVMSSQHPSLTITIIHDLAPQTIFQALMVK